MEFSVTDLQLKPEDKATIQDILNSDAKVEFRIKHKASGTYLATYIYDIKLRRFKLEYQFEIQR